MQYRVVSRLSLDRDEGNGFTSQMTSLEMQYIETGGFTVTNCTITRQSFVQKCSISLVGPHATSIHSHHDRYSDHIHPPYIPCPHPIPISLLLPGPAISQTFIYVTRLNPPHACRISPHPRVD